jgi:hypothetical protein
VDEREEMKARIRRAEEAIEQVVEAVNDAVDGQSSEPGLLTSPGTIVLSERAALFVEKGPVRFAFDAVAPSSFHGQKQAG